MKRIFIRCAALVLCVVLVFACEEKDHKERFVIRIKENKISCTGYEGQTECYLVQYASNLDSDDWEYFYEQIDGFIHEHGFMYKLLVTKETVRNPPQDASSMKYVLIRELSKERK